VLLVLGVVPALAQVPVIAALSSSSPAWGAIAVATAPALAAVLLVCGSLLRQASRAIWAFGATALVVVLFATHAIQPYRNAAPWDLTAEAHSGPALGIRTTPDRLAWAAGTQAAVASCQRPGEGLLAYGVPAAYVFANGPMDTNILWLGAFGKANQAGVSWIERTHREPTCVIIATAYLRFAHQTWNAPQGRDPLLRWMSSRYREFDQPGLSYVVLRRLGR
jgi:hypothetical protein